MTEILTSAQMRAIEAAAIASGRVTGLELMERAGQGVVEAVFAEWPALAAAPHRAVVLCGPGNNGGDGFVVARLLKGWGWEVEVFLYGEPGKLPPDARVNYERWCGMGAVGDWPSAVARFSFPSFDADYPDTDLVVDALFGIGLTHPLPDQVHAVATALNDREPPKRGWIVAVDIPSGLSAETGRACSDRDPDRAFYCDLTVTFHRPKLGHYLAEGPEFCQKLVVCDIGLPAPGDAASAASGKQVESDE